jgi:hypothetical protein
MLRMVALAARQSRDIHSIAYMIWKIYAASESAANAEEGGRLPWVASLPAVLFTMIFVKAYIHASRFPVS